jgi:hypothetical protein
LEEPTVNEHPSPQVEAENHKPLAPLVERLDPAIGEMSTVMGAMMTELLRRTLRGSVRQIDDELQTQVAAKVDSSIAQRLPAIEHSASEVAEKTAREAATEVAVEEVQALEQRAKEAQRELRSQIEETARSVEHKAAETTRELTGRITIAEKKAELDITSKAHDLTTRIEETAKHAVEKTQETARDLGRQIEEAERRANEAAQAEVNRQVEDLLQRSRKMTHELKERLTVVETTAGTLGKQLIDEAAERKAEQMTFHKDIDGRVNGLLQQLERQEQARRTAEEQFRHQFLQALEEGQTRLRGELTEALADARRLNQSLGARVAELEKPRGLRALWAWLFGRRKKDPGAAEAEETESPAVEEDEAARSV